MHTHRTTQVEKMTVAIANALQPEGRPTSRQLAGLFFKNYFIDHLVNYRSFSPL